MWGRACDASETKKARTRTPRGANNVRDSWVTGKKLPVFGFHSRITSISLILSPLRSFHSHSRNVEVSPSPTQEYVKTPLVFPWSPFDEERERERERLRLNAVNQNGGVLKHMLLFLACILLMVPAQGRGGTVVESSAAFDWESVFVYVGAGASTPVRPSTVSTGAQLENISMLLRLSRGSYCSPAE